MKQFIGTKILQAEPMTLGDFCEFMKRPTEPHKDPNTPGYHVIYQDGYASWSPAGTFEAAYRPFTGLTFGLAIDAVKLGMRVGRTGWNGKGMFVYFVPAAAYPAFSGAAKAFFGENALVPYRACLAMKTVRGDVVTWAPTVSDALAEDWYVVE